MLQSVADSMLWSLDSGGHIQRTDILSVGSCVMSLSVPEPAQISMLVFVRHEFGRNRLPAM